MKQMLLSTLPFALLFTASEAAPPESNLTFHQRLQARAAIEQVYGAYRARQGGKAAHAPSSSVLEQKVRSSAAKARALQLYWGIEIGPEHLAAELRRIEKSTRFPDRLQEIYQALGNDSVLIQETFARPILVDRLLRNLFSADERIHGTARKEAEKLRERLLDGSLDALSALPQRTQMEVRKDSFDDFAEARRRLPMKPGEVGRIHDENEAFAFEVLLFEDDEAVELATYRIPKISWEIWWSGVVETLAGNSATTVALPLTLGPLDPSVGSETAAASSCFTPDTWDSGSLDDAPPRRAWHTAVWTGTEMIIWGGYGNRSAPIAPSRYDPLTDTWTQGSSVGAPTGRRGHAAFWTGSQMLVWGGGDLSSTNTGGLYDPEEDTWTPTSTTGAPPPLSWPAAVWTGTEMIVYGSGLKTGGRYDPATDTWTPISTLNAPPAISAKAVWTGSRMLVWGGGQTQQGGAYDPTTDTWASMSTVNAPSVRGGHVAVWSGTEMIIWGGGSDNTGGRYNAATDTWTAMTTVNAPPCIQSSAAVWSGDFLVVWGGDFCGVAFASRDGGRYDPVSDTWMPMSQVNMPSQRAFHSGVWTGSEMIVWGGTGYLMHEGGHDTGGRYDPASDRWLPVGLGSGRSGMPAIWTGSEMILWGGVNWYGESLDAGARYDPLTDAWTPPNQEGAPSPRYNHSLVWTGEEMIVWGGSDGTVPLASGGRYDPETDSWSDTSLTGAPAGRTFHSAVWDGTEMIVWGGSSSGTFLDTGGRYNPNSDDWLPLNTINAPTPRHAHSAVWTGSEMVVWGGGDGVTWLSSGSRYSPSEDAWTAMDQANAPSGRRWHSAVWTGSSLLIWGGNDGASYLGTGARYHPATDTWTPITNVDAPAPRGGHSTVWTGTQMIVWGGITSPNTGGRYDPFLDAWTPVTTVGAPSQPMSAHAAVWTGDAMIVWGVVGYPQLLTYTGQGGLYRPGPDPSLDADLDGVTVCGGDCDDSDQAVFAGAPQVCADMLNNDCAHPSWPSLSDTNEMDDDGDTLSECQGDCDDSQAAVWAQPGEVADLDLSADASTLSWTAPALPGASSIAYDTLRSSTAADFVIGAACVETDDGTDTTASDSTNPPVDGVFFYLVRAQNACPLGEGSLGHATAGSPRVGRSCP